MTQALLKHMLHCSCAFSCMQHSSRDSALQIVFVVWQAIVEGESEALPFPFVVDVRNIAQAHIHAAVTPKAKGQRYLVSNKDTVPNSAVIAVLRERFPGLKFKNAQHEDPKPVLENTKVGAV